MSENNDKKSPPLSENEIARRNEKMRKKKNARDKILATKNIEKGLLIVHTGKGKGKSTAAFGMVFRALGHGKTVGIIQFVKGVWETGERTILDNFKENVTIKAMGEGFTWETQDYERDIKAAQNAWREAQKMIEDPKYDMILLDEINIVLRYQYLSIDEVLRKFDTRHPNTHIIATGRNAHQNLIDQADLVTEMTMIKHPFRAGIKAQIGVEF